MKRPDIDLDDVKDTAGAAGEKLGDAADAVEDMLSDAAHATSAKAKGLAARAKASVDERRVAARDLALSPEQRLLYCRILGAHAAADGAADPRALGNVYYVASQLELDQPGRRSVLLQMLGTVDSQPLDAVTLAGDFAATLVGAPNAASSVTTLLADLIRVSAIDRQITGVERDRIKVIAARLSAEPAQALRHAYHSTRAERSLIARRLAGPRTRAIGRSVVGYAVAAGFTRAALNAAGRGTPGAAGVSRATSTFGGRGLLKGNSVANGVIVAGLMMVAVGAATKFALSRGEALRQQRQRSLEEQVATGHARAIEDLAADLAAHQQVVAQYRTQTVRNETDLAAAEQRLRLVGEALDRLKTRRRAFDAALATAR